jgi:hypothetical protein
MFETASNFFFKIVTALTSGSVESIIVILILIVCYFVYENWRLKKDNKYYAERTDKIIDDYYKGNLSISDALNGLRHVLSEIKGKIK